MKGFGGMAVMSLMLMRLSASVAQTSSAGTTDPCGTVVVVIDTPVDANVTEHQGTFTEIGEEEEFKPVYLSDGGFILEFIEDGDEAYSYDPPLTALELSSEPADNDLEDNEDLEVAAPQEDEEIRRRRRRHLQSSEGQICGHWAIGMRNEDADVATFPMIKVFDCADSPTDIDADSMWFRQQCEDCPMEEDIGTVAISFKDDSCNPTPAPNADTLDPVASNTLPPAAVIVDPLETTAPLTADAVDPSESGSEESEDTTTTGQSGAGKIGGLGAVALAALGVAASVFSNAM